MRGFRAEAVDGQSGAVTVPVQDQLGHLALANVNDVGRFCSLIEALVFPRARGPTRRVPYWPDWRTL